MTALLAAGLVTGCSSAPGPNEDDGQHTAAAFATPEWRYFDNCATSIGAGPNDALWIVGCHSGSKDGSIWSMHFETTCGELTCADGKVWDEWTQKGNLVRVDHSSAPYVVGSNGSVNQIFLLENAQHRAVPAGWLPATPSSQCARDFVKYHLAELAQVFSFDPIALTTLDHDFRAFALLCATNAAGDSSIVKSFDGNTVAHPVATGGFANQLAIFSDSSGEALWTLKANGTIQRYDDTFNTFTTMPGPPGHTIELTDHYAMTDDAVYKYSDASRTWTRIIDRVAPSGRIVHIAHAEAVTVQPTGGTPTVYGPSDLWGLDDRGNIYQFVLSEIPR